MAFRNVRGGSKNAKKLSVQSEDSVSNARTASQVSGTKNTTASTEKSLQDKPIQSSTSDARKTGKKSTTSTVTEKSLQDKTIQSSTSDARETGKGPQVDSSTTVNFEDKRLFGQLVRGVSKLSSVAKSKISNESKENKSIEANFSDAKLLTKVSTSTSINLEEKNLLGQTSQEYSITPLINKTDVSLQTSTIDVSERSKLEESTSINFEEKKRIDQFMRASRSSLEFKDKSIQTSFIDIPVSLRVSRSDKSTSMQTQDRISKDQNHTERSSFSSSVDTEANIEDRKTEATQTPPPEVVQSPVSTMHKSASSSTQPQIRKSPENLQRKPNGISFSFIRRMFEDKLKYAESQTSFPEVIESPQVSKIDKSTWVRLKDISSIAVELPQINDSPPSDTSTKEEKHEPPLFSQSLPPIPNLFTTNYLKLDKPVLLCPADKPQILFIPGITNMPITPPPPPFPAQLQPYPFLPWPPYGVYPQPLLPQQYQNPSTPSFPSFFGMPAGIYPYSTSSSKTMSQKLKGKSSSRHKKEQGYCEADESSLTDSDQPTRKNKWWNVWNKTSDPTAQRFTKNNHGLSNTDSEECICYKETHPLICKCQSAQRRKAESRANLKTSGTMTTQILSHSRDGCKYSSNRKREDILECQYCGGSQSCKSANRNCQSFQETQDGYVNTASQATCCKNCRCDFCSVEKWETRDAKCGFKPQSVCGDSDFDANVTHVSATMFHSVQVSLRTSRTNKNQKIKKFNFSLETIKILASLFTGWGGKSEKAEVNRVCTKKTYVDRSIDPKCCNRGTDCYPIHNFEYLDPFFAEATSRKIKTTSCKCGPDSIIEKTDFFTSTIKRSSYGRHIKSLMSRFDDDLSRLPYRNMPKCRLDNKQPETLEYSAQPMYTKCCQNRTAEANSNLAPFSNTANDIYGYFSDSESNGYLKYCSVNEQHHNRPYGRVHYPRDRAPVCIKLLLPDACKCLKKTHESCGMQSNICSRKQTFTGIRSCQRDVCRSDKDAFCFKKDHINFACQFQSIKNENEMSSDNICSSTTAEIEDIKDEFQVDSQSDEFLDVSKTTRRDSPRCTHRQMQSGLKCPQISKAHIKCGFPGCPIRTGRRCNRLIASKNECPKPNCKPRRNTFTKPDCKPRPNTFTKPDCTLRRNTFTKPDCKPSQNTFTKEKCTPVQEKNNTKWRFKSKVDAQKNKPKVCSSDHENRCSVYAPDYRRSTESSSDYQSGVDMPTRKCEGTKKSKNTSCIREKPCEVLKPHKHFGKIRAAGNFVRKQCKNLHSQKTSESEDYQEKDGRNLNVCKIPDTCDDSSFLINKSKTKSHDATGHTSRACKEEHTFIKDKDKFTKQSEQSCSSVIEDYRDDSVSSEFQDVCESKSKASVETANIDNEDTSHADLSESFIAGVAPSDKHKAQDKRKAGPDRRIYRRFTSNKCQKSYHKPCNCYPIAEVECQLPRKRTSSVCSAKIEDNYSDCICCSECDEKVNTDVERDRYNPPSSDTQISDGTYQQKCNRNAMCRDLSDTDKTYTKSSLGYCINTDTLETNPCSFLKDASQKEDLSNTEKCATTASQKEDLSNTEKCATTASQKEDLSNTEKCATTASQKGGSNNTYKCGQNVCPFPKIYPNFTNKLGKKVNLKKNHSNTYTFETKVCARQKQEFNNTDKCETKTSQKQEFNNTDTFETRIAPYSKGELNNTETFQINARQKADHIITDKCETTRSEKEGMNNTDIFEENICPCPKEGPRNTDDFEINASQKGERRNTGTFKTSISYKEDSCNADTFTAKTSNIGVHSNAHKFETTQSQRGDCSNKFKTETFETYSPHREDDTATFETNDSDIDSNQTETSEVNKERKQDINTRDEFETILSHLDKYNTQPNHINPTQKEKGNTMPHHMNKCRTGKCNAKPNHINPNHTDKCNTMPNQINQTHTGKCNTMPNHINPTHTGKSNTMPNHINPTHTDKCNAQPNHIHPTHTGKCNTMPHHINPTHTGKSNTMPNHTNPTHTGKSNTMPNHINPTHTGKCNTMPNHINPTYTGKSNTMPNHINPTHTGKYNAAQSHTNPILTESFHTKSNHKEPDINNKCHANPNHLSPYRRDPSHIDLICRDSSRRDPYHRDPNRRDPSRRDPNRMDPSRIYANRRDPSRRDPSRRDPSHRDPSRRNECRTKPSHIEPIHTDTYRASPSCSDPSCRDEGHAHPNSVESYRKDICHTNTSSRDPSHRDRCHTNTRFEDPVRRDSCHTNPCLRGPSPRDKRHANPSSGEPSRRDKRHANPSSGDPSRRDKRHANPSSGDPSHTDECHAKPSHIDPINRDKYRPQHSSRDPIHRDVFHTKPSDRDPNLRDKRHANPSSRESSYKDICRKDPSSKDPSSKDPSSKDQSHRDKYSTNSSFRDPIRRDKCHINPSFEDPSHTDKCHINSKFEDPSHTDKYHINQNFIDPNRSDVFLTESSYTDPNHRDRYNVKPRSRHRALRDECRTNPCSIEQSHRESCHDNPHSAEQCHREKCHAHPSFGEIHYRDTSHANTSSAESSLRDTCRVKKGFVEQSHGDKSYTKPSSEEPSQREKYHANPSSGEPDRRDKCHAQTSSRGPSHRDKCHANPSSGEQRRRDKYHENPCSEEPSRRDKCHANLSSGEPSRRDKCHANQSSGEPSRRDKCHANPSSGEASRRDKSHTIPCSAEERHRDKCHANQSSAELSHTGKSHTNPSSADPHHRDSSAEPSRKDKWHAHQMSVEPNRRDKYHTNSSSEELNHIDKCPTQPRSRKPSHRDKCHANPSSGEPSRRVKCCINPSHTKPNYLGTHHKFSRRADTIPLTPCQSHIKHRDLNWTGKTDPLQSYLSCTVADQTDPNNNDVYESHSSDVHLREEDTCHKDPYQSHSSSDSLREADPYESHSSRDDLLEADPYESHSVTDILREADPYQSPSGRDDLLEADSYQSPSGKDDLVEADPYQSHSVTDILREADPYQSPSGRDDLVEADPYRKDPHDRKLHQIETIHKICTWQSYTSSTDLSHSDSSQCDRSNINPIDEVPSQTGYLNSNSTSRTNIETLSHEHLSSFATEQQGKVSTTSKLKCSCSYNLAEGPCYFCSIPVTKTVLQEINNEMSYQEINPKVCRKFSNKLDIPVQIFRTTDSQEDKRKYPNDGEFQRIWRPDENDNFMDNSNSTENHPRKQIIFPNCSGTLNKGHYCPCRTHSPTVLTGKKLTFSETCKVESQYQEPVPDFGSSLENSNNKYTSDVPNKQKQSQSPTSFANYLKCHTNKPNNQAEVHGFDDVLTKVPTMPHTSQQQCHVYLTARK